MGPVTLAPVSPARRQLLADLLFDYQRELAAFTHASDDEVREYPYLPEYFTDADRSALFIMVGDEIGGFVLISRWTILTGDAHVISEFSVRPPYRRSRVGERAALLAFALFPGRWEVAEMASNAAAIHFWRHVIGTATNDRYTETVVSTDAWHGPVQSFQLGSGS